MNGIFFVISNSTHCGDYRHRHQNSSEMHMPGSNFPRTLYKNYWWKCSNYLYQPKNWYSISIIKEVLCFHSFEFSNRSWIYRISLIVNSLKSHFFKNSVIVSILIVKQDFNFFLFLNSGKHETHFSILPWKCN